MTLTADFYLGAEFDETRSYRYKLWRRWSYGFPSVAWIMLNPSTADERKDDPTIRRCINFSRSWGFGGMEIYNLFAFRSAYPHNLLTAPDPVGPRNNEFLLSIPDDGTQIIAAWGCLSEKLGRRDKDVLELLKHRCIHCLGVTVQGFPKHPVRLAGNTEREVYWDFGIFLPTREQLVAAHQEGRTP